MARRVNEGSPAPPPSTTPALNRTTNKPLAAIFFLFPGRPATRPQPKILQTAIDRKSSAIAMAYGLSTCSFLRTCCRNAALDFRRSPACGMPANSCKWVSPSLT